MRISRERLMAESESTGFRPEILEKVIHLLSLLEILNSHPQLKGKLAIKGGTALNRKDWRMVKVDDIGFEASDLENQLIPVLRADTLT